MNPADVDDNEDDNGRTGAVHIQKKLSALVDNAKVSRLGRRFEDADLIEDSLRLTDLRDEHQEHSWMWALNPVTEPVLPEEDWLRAMRLRLGCDLISTDVLCASCGARVLDKGMYHALCCARGESTRGHNRVRDVMRAGFAAADAGASAEGLGLIPSMPDLRPADILTMAAQPNRITAVDVGITAPHAARAGQNCVESMREEKNGKYGPYLTEQGIEYAPATFSTFGRRHPCVTQMMLQAAREAARRRGIGNHSAMLRRWNRSISCEIWRRASRMVVACIPREPRQTAFLLEGDAEEGPALSEVDDDELPEADDDDDLESNLDA